MGRLWLVRTVDGMVSKDLRTAIADGCRRLEFDDTWTVETENIEAPDVTLSHAERSYPGDPSSYLQSARSDSH